MNFLLPTTVWLLCTKLSCNLYHIYIYIYHIYMCGMIIIIIIITIIRIWCSERFEWFLVDSFDSYRTERIRWKQLVGVFSRPTTPRRMIRTSNPMRRRRHSEKNDLASRHPRQLAFFFLPFPLPPFQQPLSSTLFHSVSPLFIFHSFSSWSVCRLFCYSPHFSLFFPVNPSPFSFAFYSSAFSSWLSSFFYIVLASFYFLDLLW